MALDPGGGFGSPSSSLPRDWTDGAGVIPASGSIVIPNPSTTGQTRKWLLVQNQSASTLTVLVQALTSGGALVNVPILLTGVGAATQGGGQEFSAVGSWCPNSQITISGTAGIQCCVLEILE